MHAFTRKGDFWSGLALAGLGAYIVHEALGWDYVGEAGPGPGFFPVWYGGAMIVLSLLLVAGAVLKHAPDTGNGPDWANLRRVGLCWLALVASILLMNVLGFELSFGLLIWFIVAVMFRQPQRIALSLAVGGAVVFHLLFVQALELLLPAGMLF